MDIFALMFVFLLAGFLGFELINRVLSQLHTTLMSGTNAISGITIVGADIGNRKFRKLIFGYVDRIFYNNFINY